MAVRMQKLEEPILITGAAGFIGRRLLNRLLEENKEIIAFDVVACPESLEDCESLTWIQGDITNEEHVRGAVSQCKTVFHLAAMVGDWGKASLHEAVTVKGTQYLFDAAKMCGQQPKVILASSIVVYSHQIGKGVCHEGMDHGRVFGPYSESKQQQEKIAQRFIQQGLDVRIVRPANVYGAGSKPWVEELCHELQKGIPVLINGGDYDAGLVHVDNVVDVLIRVARNPKARGQIYNVADEEGVTWKQYMTDLAKICDAPKPRSIPRLVADYLATAGETAFRLLGIDSRPPLTKEALNLVGSKHAIAMTKTKTELGFKTVTCYQDGIAEVRDYLRPQIRY